MHTHRLPGSRLTVTLLLAAALAGCATDQVRTPSPELQQRIASASTPADHEAIAVVYERDAATARSTAEEHRRMARLYRNQPVGGRGGNMTYHCETLVKMYDGIAGEYEKLAAEHRQMRDRVAR